MPATSTIDRPYFDIVSVNATIVILLDAVAGTCSAKQSISQRYSIKFISKTPEDIEGQ
jgi:hypothetical protein